MLLRRLCGETETRLTMIVEQPASDHDVAALGGDVRELTLAELVAETPVMPEDPWGIFDQRAGVPMTARSIRRCLTSTSRSSQAHAMTCCSSTTPAGRCGHSSSRGE